MSYFFNGRLWTSPAVMSQVNDSAMFNRNPSIGNVLALIGTSAGGQPNTALTFASPEDAQRVLVSGDLLDAVVRAFAPSREVPAGPAQVVAVRVNPATQSTLSLLNGSAAAVITLTSTDYGLRTTQIKVKVEAATTRGLKLTTGLGSGSYSKDDVYRDILTARYTGGQATATLTVANAQVVLSAPSGTPVATIDLNAYDTVQKLVDRINTVTGFTASVNDGNGDRATVNALDSLTAVDVKTANVIVTANLQACVDWFNSVGEGFITATRVGGAGLQPAVVAYTYLTGGVDGTVTNTEYSNALTVLQSEDVQWVVPCSDVPAIHAMVDAHVAFMSATMRRERRSIVGTPLATTDVAAIALAKAIGSDRTSMVHLGVYDFDASGALVLYKPFITAAMIAGGFCGVNPGTAMTNKSLRVRGVERKLRNPTDTDALLNGGVIPLEVAYDGSFRVVKSISTWLTNGNFNRVEQSVGVALDFTSRSVREAVEELKGAKGSPAALGLAMAKVETTLRALSVPEPNGPGVLAGDIDNPAYKNISVKLEGDVMSISFQCSPVIPINYIPVTIYAVPYSGSVSI